MISEDLHRFAAAKRHSLWVRLLRRGIELGTLCGFLALIVFVYLRNFRDPIHDVTFDHVGFDGRRITMDRPHLTGTHTDGGMYNLTAEKALQDPLHPNGVDLVAIHGDITSAGRGTSKVSAHTGHYETGSDTLDLFGDVQFRNAQYEMSLKSIHILFKKGDYLSHEAVRILIFPDTIIEADGIEIHNGGAQATCVGNVRTLIQTKAK